jgi:hypothetical protein
MHEFCSAKLLKVVGAIGIILFLIENDVLYLYFREHDTASEEE